MTTRTLVAVETERPADQGMPATRDPGDLDPGGRDPDLVALEGLEAEFTDLESELNRVEESRPERPVDPAT